MADDRPLRRDSEPGSSLGEKAFLFWLSLAVSALFLLTPLTLLIFDVGVATPLAWCDTAGFSCYGDVFVLPLWLPGAQLLTVLVAVVGATVEKRLGHSHWPLRITGLLLYPLAWAIKIVLFVVLRSVG